LAILFEVEQEYSAHLFDSGWGFLDIVTDQKAAAPFILIYIGIVAFLIISKIPTYSFKGYGQRVDRDYVLPILAGSVLFTALLISFPWWCLSAIMFLYLALLPIGWRSFQKRTRADLDAKPAAPDAVDVD